MWFIRGGWSWTILSVAVGLWLPAWTTTGLGLVMIWFGLVLPYRVVVGHLSGHVVVVHVEHVGEEAVGALVVLLQPGHLGVEVDGLAGQTAAGTGHTQQPRQPLKEHLGHPRRPGHKGWKIMDDWRLDYLLLEIGVWEIKLLYKTDYWISD